MYVYIHTYIHTYEYIFIHSYMNIYIQYIRTYIYMNMQEGDEAVVEKIDLTKLGNGKPSAEDMRTLLAEKVCVCVCVCVCGYAHRHI